MKIGYTGPDKCPVCNQEMMSWFHLESHSEELYQRALNSNDAVIAKLKDCGCIVNRNRRFIAVHGPVA